MTIIEQARAATTRQEYEAVSLRFHSEVDADRTPANTYFAIANAVVDAHARTTGGTK